jgi:4-hydroxybenzoate polyprenyltransferase
MMQNISLEDKSIFVFIKVSRIHIVALAAMGTFTFGWLFTGVYPWLLTGVCALDWYIVNLLNKAVDLREDSVNQITGTQFIGQHKKRVTTIIVIVLVVSIVLIHVFNPFITALRIFCHLLGFLYNWPLLPGKRRLKHLYFWKNTTSAIGFIITIVGYPLAPTLFYHHPAHFPADIHWATVYFSALFLFLFILSNEIIYDLRDIPGDRVVGLRTYPVVHGKRVASRIIDGLIVASVIVLSIGYVFHFLPWRVFILACAPIFQFIFYKQMLRNGVTAKYCTGMTWIGAAMFIVYHLWLIAGLPGAGL